MRGALKRFTLGAFVVAVALLVLPVAGAAGPYCQPGENSHHDEQFAIQGSGPAPGPAPENCKMVDCVVGSQRFTWDCVNGVVQNAFAYPPSFCGTCSYTGGPRCCDTGWCCNPYW
jgi:hypothetical protein